MTMKLAMTAMAVVLLAGTAAPAFAQPRGDRDRAERPAGGHTYRGWTADRRGGGEQAPRVREAPPAPAPPQAAEPRRNLGGDRAGPADGRRGDGVRDSNRYPDGRREWRGDNRPRGDRPDGDGRRDWDRRGGDRREWGQRDGDRRGGDRRDWDRRGDGDHRDWNRRGDRDHHDWDRRGGDHRRWERARYPSVYTSSYRYRHAWRPPTGFYVRSWGYGEFLPRGWFGRSYWIADPWQFDLPLPPPGFVWVRSGFDVLLVDEYSGRIVQVVRDIFW